MDIDFHSFSRFPDLARLPGSCIDLRFRFAPATEDDPTEDTEVRIGTWVSNISLTRDHTPVILRYIMYFVLQNQKKITLPGLSSDLKI